MGCFSFTCCLTGLPITAGDPVKFFLLTENPYDSNLVCYVHDMWFPRTWPINAVYNDYGSIENYDANSPGVLATVEGLKQDLVEVGTGDNSIHDVPTKKGMSFEQTLEAVWEQRIQVSREVENRALQRIATFEPQPPAWRPTLQKVEALLQQAGYSVANQDGSFLVDEKGDGWVRVRNGGYSDNFNLESLLPIFQKDFSAMVTPGSGSYSHRVEIQIMPQALGLKDVNTEGRYRSFLRVQSDKPLTVYQAMILTEAWDKLVETQNFQVSRQRIQEAWNQRIKDLSANDKYAELLRGLGRLPAENATYAESLVAKSAIPFAMGLAEHFDLGVKLHLNKPFTEAQISEFLDNVAGFGCIHELLYPNRYWWRPSFSCGPQFGEYQSHVEFHRKVLEVAQKLENARLEEERKWDLESEKLVEPTKTKKTKTKTKAKTKTKKKKKKKKAK